MTHGLARIITLTALAASLSVPSSAAIAQTGTTTLVGVVRDTAGHPIPGVQVVIRNSELAGAITGENGGFRLPVVPIGPLSVSVRRLGFVPAAIDVVLRAGRIDSLVVDLQVMAAKLPGVLVEDEADARSHRLLAGFWERRSRGFGHFITHDEILAKDPHDFTDIVRMTPSVNITTKNGRRDIRFGRGGSPRGDCPPQYFVDGVRIENGRADEFSAEDIEAVELYSGAATIPAQFTPRFNTLTCGVIVIWTRVPGI